MISKPMVHLAQTMLLSCDEINTISKWTETSFYFTHVTLEYHRWRPKWFQSLWYIQRKPCFYHVMKLILSPNGPRRVSTSHTSRWSTIGGAQNDFRAYGIFGANHAPILYWDLYYHQTDGNELPLDQRHLGVPSVCPIWLQSLWYIWRKPCTYLASRLILSPNRLK
jgi:hypothetical protein